MISALDGKITGPYLKTPEHDISGKHYESTHQSYHPDAWLCGRVTTDQNFTMYAKPDIDENSPEVPEGDYVAKDNCESYYVSVDTSGRIGWRTNTLKYLNRPDSHIIEVLSEKVPNSYRAFLRKYEISYIIAGKEHLDCQVAVEKLQKLFHIKTLMVEGGGFINYTFLQSGLIDELSMIIIPVADGENNTVTLFERSDFMDPKTFTFSLKDVQKLEGNTVWLKYTVNKN
ncbi:5-amino-6-(5-phosphoribosylamino)uracil reductase [Histomonas meleagridis]|uniref:5-amino-6-(5-phosphoribosylamino)uracil reductase n=1 Tax=Histomonas meleagridis TaxID=135588 RepID=UPI003559ABE8|nr:5-amino-6-(5-phosphoribosylamino)uracil reductase [Histomonas meleagridis]KAH0803901.1 5-amino-6-(5-phosphoribosylamino)uracil reductase [Histomonas meleagridis]